MCLYGLTLSLQSENPETLQAINRRNLTREQRDAAIEWASQMGFAVTTELIFGLPHETRDSFMGVLNNSAAAGFDSIQCYNLIILDSIELNRPEARQRYGIQTKWRHVSASYQYIGDEFCAEAEEVVVASNTLDVDDFLVVRGLNMMFHAIFYLKLHHWFFKYICGAGIPLADFLSRLLRPDSLDSTLPEGYRQFVDEFEAAVRGELFDSREAVVDQLRKVCHAKSIDDAEPIKITPHFIMRLIYGNQDWVPAVLRRTLAEFTTCAETLDMADFLLDLGGRERIDLYHRRLPQPLTAHYDALAWRRDKFRRRLESYPIAPRRIQFAQSARFREVGETFQAARARGNEGHFAHQEAEDFYLDSVGHFTLAPVELLHELSYAAGGTAIFKKCTHGHGVQRGLGRSRNRRPLHAQYHRNTDFLSDPRVPIPRVSPGRRHRVRTSPRYRG